MKSYYLKNSIILMLFLITSSIYLIAQCPEGAITPTPGAALTIKSGEVYCISSDISLLSVSIEEGGELILAPKVTVEANGIFTIDGYLTLYDYAGLKLTGAMNQGSRYPADTKISIGNSAFISMTGSFTQFDPGANPAHPNAQAKIRLSNNAVMEICGTYSQFSGNYPAVDYAGDMDHVAYFITKAPASGVGSSILSGDEETTWIAIGQVANLNPGDASYCGPNASPDKCDIWPSWLSAEYYNCFDAENNRDISLPIVLVSFDVVKNGLIASLTWATAVEYNHSGFEIQRSSDGINWSNLGFIAASQGFGVNTVTTRYAFDDLNPLPGNNFYRLKQVDTDGSFSFSPVRTVGFMGKIDDLQVYPNPVNNVVNIAGVAPNSVIKIFDMAGNQVNRKFTLSAMNSFDLSTCKEGIYLIVVSDGSGNTETFKILKDKVP